MRITGPSHIEWTIPYAGTGFTRGASGYSSDPPGQGQDPFPGWGTVDADGAITATLTWTPDYQGDIEPPPPAVIIKQSADAHWSGGAGRCSDGLGDVPTGGLTDGNSSGDHYTVIRAPPLVITRTCTPYVHCSRSSGAGSECCAGSVAYSVESYPVRLTLEGLCASDPDPRLLIGQKLRSTASVGLGSLIAKKFTWNISGGAPFIAYAPTTPTTFTPWSEQITTTTSDQDQIGNFFATPAGTVTITCVVELPSLARYAILNRTVKTDQPNVYQGGQSIGEMTLLPSTSAPNELALHGAVLPGSPRVWGIYFKFWAETAMPYVPGDTGTFSAAQLVQDASTITTQQGTTFIQPIRSLALDGSYPYPNLPFVSASPHIFEGQTYWRLFSDRPAIGGLPGNPPLISCEYNASFQLFVMYDAPDNGIGHAHVPLLRLNWTAHRGASSGSPWTYDGPDGSAFGTLDFPPHPQWIDVIH